MLHPRLIFRCIVLLLVMVLIGPLAAARRSTSYQQYQTEAGGELLANLAAGRVEVLVCKDGVVVATVESHVEPDTLPPMIVPLSAFRVGVFLGPVEWIWPGSSRQPLRLDATLRRAGSDAARPKRADQAAEATDIESIGLGILEPLRNASGLIHSQLHVEQMDLFAELLIAGYAKDYGPEVWSLRYKVEQRILRTGFYQTVVHRPEYIQLYPPEKGKPRTLVETRYPPEDSSEPQLLELLKNGESQITALRRADVKLGRAADLVEKGESQKVPYVDGLEFVRAAMQAVTPKGRRQMMATIQEEKGVEWVLGEELSGPAIPAEKREPAAPSLYKQPLPPQRPPTKPPQ